MFKHNTTSQLLFFLDANSALRKQFESLAIQMKNFLIPWETEEKYCGYKTWAENPLTKEEKLGKKLVSWVK